MTSSSTLRQTLLSALLVAGLVGFGTPAAAQHRARLSKDLTEKLAAGDQQIDVIVQGTAAEVAALAQQHSVRVKRGLKNGAVLQVNAGQLAALQADAGVDHLSGDTDVRASADITRETIGADQIWAGAGNFPRPLNGRGVVVAVIDSGVDRRHAALAGRVVASVDFTGGNGADGYGHGTHIASLIAGAPAASADYSGVAPGARIVSLRVLDNSGAGKASSVIDAIEWAIDNRVRYNISVINLSLGGPVTSSYQDDPLCEAAERAVKAGITVVAAAGNFGQTPDGKQIFGSITSPANDPMVIAVGALDTRGTAVRSDDRIAKFSSRGPTMYDQLIKPDLVAPGRNVVAAEAAGSLLATQSPERHVAGSGANGYIQLSGSSMSAGVVSGAVALLLDRRPGLSPAAVRSALQVTSSFMGGEGLVATGAGSLNVLAAVNFVDRSAGAVAPTTIAGESILPGGLAIDPSKKTVKTLSTGAAGTATGTVMGSKVVWGTSAGDTIIWGASSSFDTIVWGSNSNDTIIWGSSASDTIVWGSGTQDTIIWGSGSLDTIVWGSSARGKIVWGSRGDDTIIWGSRGDDTIIWGSHAGDTIVWGSGTSDTIIWGSRTGDTIIWGSGLVSDTIIWGSTIVWGSVNGQTIVWGSNVADTIVWGSDSNDTIIWGSGTSDTIIWGSNGQDTIIWGSSTPDTIIWG